MQSKSRWCGVLFFKCEHSVMSIAFFSCSKSWLALWRDSSFCLFNFSPWRSFSRFGRRRDNTQPAYRLCSPKVHGWENAFGYMTRKLLSGLALSGDVVWSMFSSFFSREGTHLRVIEELHELLRRKLVPPTAHALDQCLLVSTNHNWLRK